LFLHASRTMRVQPSSCAVVEDMPSGVKAAVSAGMRAIGYAAHRDGDAPRNPTELTLREAGAVEVCPSLDELPALLDLG
jgi:beta-phosphoglucomutase-like phosphatase (HAD superfamily)